MFEGFNQNMSFNIDNAFHRVSFTNNEILNKDIYLSGSDPTTIIIQNSGFYSFTFNSTSGEISESVLNTPYKIGLGIVNEGSRNLYNTSYMVGRPEIQCCGNLFVDGNTTINIEIFAGYCSYSGNTLTFGYRDIIFNIRRIGKFYSR